jgi:hypothetical protein
MVGLFPIQRRTSTVAILAAAIFLLHFSAAGLGADESTWLSGEAIDEALQGKVSVTWSNIPVRRALESLCKAQKLALLLDRRVDPDQKIELHVDNVPLREALEQIAARLKIGVALIGPVVYFGPKATATRLRTVATLRDDDVRNLKQDAQTTWRRAERWSWEKLSTPRDLLTTLAGKNGLEIEGLEQIPADLWGAADLAPLNLAQRLTLILAQYDLTFEIGKDGKSVRLAPMPAKPVVERTYPISGRQDFVSQLRGNPLLAGAEIKVANDQVVVRGREEDQEIVRNLRGQRPAMRATEGKKVYTLHVQLPIGELLHALGPQMGLEIQLDKEAIAAAKISLATKVEVNLKDASADELLKAVLDPAGLTYVRHENVIEVKPK